MSKTYQLRSEIPVNTATKQIEDLLSDEGVDYVSTDRSLTSVSTPFVMLGVQRRLYTRNNWTGINPFAFITGINVQFCSNQADSTRVTVRINQRRAILFAVFWTICAYLAASALPIWESLLVAIGVAGVSWLGIVTFLGGHLVKSEINSRLTASMARME